MTTAIEGDIKGAFDNVNHKILIKILKLKINDKKFLKLIETGRFKWLKLLTQPAQGPRGYLLSLITS